MKKVIVLLAAIISINSTQAQTTTPKKSCTTVKTVSKGHDIKVTITGFKSNKGSLKIALYDSKTHFLSVKKLSKKVAIKNQQVTITFENIPSGTYAISCFHDGNSNGILDRNNYGAPTEPYAISNDAKGVMGPPSWEDAKFEVKDKAINILLKL